METRRKYLQVEQVTSTVPRMTVEIMEVAMETVGNEDFKREIPVLRFYGNVDPMPLNEANLQTIEDWYGDSDNWRRKEIELFQSKVVFCGNTKLCVRVTPKPPEPPTIWFVLKRILYRWYDVCKGCKQ